MKFKKSINALLSLSTNNSKNIIGSGFTKVVEIDNGVYMMYFIDNETGHVYNLIGNRVC